MRRGNQWAKLIWLLVVLYMFFAVGRLVYKNFQLNREESSLRNEIVALENEIQHLENQIIYFQSEAYKEKMLRARLNLKKEGERVIVIAPAPEVKEVVVEESNAKKTNPEKWAEYFIGPNR